MDPMQNRGRRPDTKRPRPVAAGDFLAISSVPDAFVKFSQLRWAQKNRLQMEGESRGRPVKNCSVPDASVNKLRNGWRRRGRCCGASVGTTGSAPRALACCPWSVMRGLCWNHWFRPSCACVLAALPGNVVQEVRIELCDFCSLKKRDFWAQRKWFKFKCNGPQNFLSFTLRWFTLYEFLAEAPGPEKTNKILAEAPGPEKTDKILMKHVNFQ